jgi:hypothetical protein
MKKRRPTIPLFLWKLAVNTESTKQIQNHSSSPAHNCECEWCLLWRNQVEELLPDTIKEQLLRIGIDLNRPSELYKFGQDIDHYSMRVIYHLVGKVLSGPIQRIDKDGDKFLTYQTVRKVPYFSLNVIPENQSLEYCPKLNDSSAGDVIIVDFRLDVPK